MNDIEQPTEAAPAPEQKGGKGIWLIAIIVLVAIGIAVAYATGMFGGEDAAPAGDVAVDPSAIVASVNGMDITRGELDEKMEQVKQSVPMGAVDPSQDAAFELQLLDELINLKLLTSLAKERNFSVSADEIDAEIAILTEQFGGEELFNQQLATLGLTKEELYENMENELLIRQLIDADTDIMNVEVSEEEIQATYEAAIGDSEDGPELDQVRELLRAQLIQQKSAMVVDEYVEQVRATANIQVNL